MIWPTPLRRHRGQVWDLTLTEMLIVALEAMLRIEPNLEMQTSTVSVADPLVLWSDMMSTPDD